MRTRLLIPLALLALGGLIAPACGGDDSSDTAAKTSDERTDSGDSGSGDSGSGSTDSGDSDSGSDDSSSDTSTPDLGDITESIPGMENLSDCLDLATTYSSLYLEALGGPDGAKDAQAKAEDLKSQLPDELHDEIDVIADAIGEVADKGIVNGSDAMDTPEYEKADKTIQNYLTKECGG